MPTVLTEIQLATLKEALQSLKNDCEQELYNVGEVVMHRETMDGITTKNNETIAACDALLKLFKLEDEKPLMACYIDLAHAVSTIFCLQQHFKQISDRLDSIGVPASIQIADEEKKLTVQQRVAVLIETMNNLNPERFYKWETALFYASNGVDQSFPFDPRPVDPEEILAIIYGEKPEPWHWGEWHNENT